MKGFTWLDVKANIELAAIKLKQNWHDKKLFIDKVVESTPFSDFLHLFWKAIQVYNAI